MRIKAFLRSKKGVASIVLLLLLLWFYCCLPKRLFQEPYSLVICDRSGELLQARIAADGQWRFPEQQDIPEKFKKAIVACEDKRFYKHFGIDPLALFRAIRQNIQAGKIRSGASTLTMQTIRLSRQQPRTFFQKFIELILAVRLECSYGKAEILTLYCSHAPFGGNVIGVDAAAWRYFGRSASKLSWSEVACLAVLPNSPGLIHPGRNRTQLKEKRDRLLGKLAAQGILTPSQVQLAVLEPLPGEPLPLPQDAPHLMTRVMEHYAAEGQFRSSIQRSLQKQVSRILATHSKELRGNEINNAAALVMEVESGKVIAYVGNVYDAQNAEYGGEVDAISAARSPGSTLKPLLYAGMLQDGRMLPKSLVWDIPTQVAGYTPQNFDLTYDGAVPADKALQRSLNIPAVRTLQAYRIERFYDLLKKMGCTTLQFPASHYGLSLILGGGENSLWELAGMYSSLARSLLHYPGYSSRYDPEDWRMPTIDAGEEHPAKEDITKLQAASLLEAGAVYSTFSSMTELMRPGDEALWTQFSSSRKIAWKTGTSFGFRDGWAIGLDPKYVVAVWVGNVDGEGRPGLTGISTAAPILFDIFKLLPTTTWFQPPYDNMITLEVCRQSGYKVGPNCVQRDSLLVPANGQQTGLCPYHQLIHLDAGGKYRVTSDCEEPSKMKQASWFILPPVVEYYYRQHNADYRNLPPFKPGCEGATQKTMEFIYPKPYSKIYVPLELDGSIGRSIFEVAHRDPNVTLFWHLDDVFLGSTTEFHQMSVAPKPGKHRIVVAQQNGERLEAVFEVLARK